MAQDSRSKPKPLIHKELLQRVESYVAIGKRKARTVLVGAAAEIRLLTQDLRRRDRQRALSYQMRY